jgi:acyl-CoA reductase-like NAD-dependent aldehyde dehydrogenase
MVSFPPIEPFRRSWDFGVYAITEEPAWASASVRYRHGNLENVAQSITLSYVDLYDDEAQLIRDHYVTQQGGTLAFNLPTIIWSGLTAPPLPTGARVVYAAPPTEQQKSGGLYDLTVSLTSVF